MQADASPTCEARCASCSGSRTDIPCSPLLAIGLAGYALWRFLEAFADANRKGTAPKALGVRAGYAASGFVYGSLAVYAARGSRSHTPGAARPHIAGGLDAWISESAAEWLIPLAGLCLIGYAIQQFASAWRGNLDSRVSAGAAAPRNRRLGHRGEPLRDCGASLRVRGHRRPAAESPSKSPSAAADTNTVDSLRWLVAPAEWTLGARGRRPRPRGLRESIIVHARYSA